MSRPLSRRDDKARKRQLLLTHRPYLRRNVLKYLRKMGNLVSSWKRTAAGSKRPHDDSSFAQDEENEDLRPAKRRRIINPNYESPIVRDTLDDEAQMVTDHALGGSTRASSRASSLRLGLAPSDFYGKSCSSSNLSSSGWVGETDSSTDNLAHGFVPNAPVKFQPAMRVRVLSINPCSEDQEEEFVQHLDPTIPTEFGCRCSVAVYAKSKHVYSPPIADEDFELVCKKTLPCTLRVTFGPDGEIFREIIMPEPFLFKAKDLYVTTRRRKRNDRNGATETTYDLASKYKLLVDITKIRYHEHWPPVDIPPVSGLETPISKAIRDDGLEKEDLTFFCQADPTKDYLTISPQLQVGYGTKLQRQPLQYAVKLEVRWSMPSHLTARAVEASRATVESKMATLALTAPTEPVSPGLTKRDEENPTTTSPNSRSQRHRTSVSTYNVKQTFRDQLGRKPLKIRDDGGAPSVTYHLGKAGIVDIGVKLQYEVPDLNCPFCIKTRYIDFNELFIHLTTDHTCFRFTVPRRNKPPKFSIFIEILKERGQSTHSLLGLAETQRTFQLTQSSNLFDLSKYVNGDESWIKHRYGPQHNGGPQHLLPATHDSSHSSSPHESRRSSPNTSTGTNDRVEFDLIDAKKDLFLLPSRVKIPLFVPATAKPLYDTVTKQILPAGVELPDSDDEKDDWWLEMKHRGIVMDYTDVTPEEKEYANKWNLFILRENLTCSKFLDKSVVKFVQQTKAWLVEKPTRKSEFLKHIEVFILRGDIKESVRARIVPLLDATQRVLRADEETERRNQDGNIVMEEAPTLKTRNRNACACGKIPSHQERMICNGKSCPARFYHKICAKDMRRPLLLREWKCNHCFS